MISVSAGLMRGNDVRRKLEVGDAITSQRTHESTAMRVRKSIIER